MADISMCQSEICPSRNTCYRFLATPSLFSQSWIDFEVTLGQEEKCDDYIECDSKDQFRRMER